MSNQAAAPLARMPRPHERAQGWPLADWWIALALFVAALLPRALGTGSIVTVDEAYHWFDRCVVFLNAVRSGNYAATNIIGHPGVTTMWLGAAGTLLRDALIHWGVAVPEGGALHRSLLRLPVAATTSLCLALAYPLMRRLWGGRVALLAAAFWLADPFMIAHSQLLHLDALLASFCTLALLAALHAFRVADPLGEPAVRWPLLLGSGVAGGLALLTKSPSVLLVPMIGLIALSRTGVLRKLFGGQRGAALDWREAWRGWRVYGAAAIVWGVAALAVWFALWPATWVHPLQAAGRMFLQAEADGGSPHGWGNFFMGQPASDPGVFFYPVALLFRLTPWALVGALLLLVVWRKSDLRGRAALGLLALFALLFVVMMSIPPKKFDRYVLPVVPALDMLAAAGWIGAGDLLEKRLHARLGRAVTNGGALALALLLAANLAWYHPYELAYYNPLLGGGAVAAHVIPVGWGEGYEQVGAYIMAQPDGRDKPIAAWFEPVLRPNVDNYVVPLAWLQPPGRVDYAMLYIDQIQRDDVPEAIRELRALTPVHTVRIHGIDYAYIYQLPEPVALSRPATFGDALHLRGYALDTAAVRASGVLTLTLNWQDRATVNKQYTMFVHVLDQHGTKAGQADLPPGGPRAPTSAWQPGHYVNAIHTIPLPKDVPAGQYWIAIGLYDPQSFARLPLNAPPIAGSPDDGADALLIGPVMLGGK